MKKIIFISVFLFLGVAANASDEMNNEIICTKIREPGSFDNSLTVILKSNPMAWVKLIEIVESGYLGVRTIGYVQVPLLPVVSQSSRGFPLEVDLVYEGNEATLRIRVA